MKQGIRSILPELIVGFCLTLVITCFFWGSDNYRNRMVESDGRGYYAYLPAVFIQQDLSFQSTYKVEKKEFNNSFVPFYLIEGEDGRTFNKYYPGVAVMQAPFFLIAWMIESTYSDSSTGYSMLFLKLLQLGSIFYITLGFFFLRKYLNIVMNDKRSALLASIFIFAGTNLFFIAIVKTSFSHHLSFCLFAAFAYHIRMYLSSEKRKHIIYVGLILGLITLVRPLNILIVLAIPLILGDWKNIQAFFTRLFQFSNWHLVSSFFSFSLSIGFLFMLNFLSSGNIMNWSYDGEGFNFSNSHLWVLLFSYRIGIFIHVPLLLLSLVGCYFLFKKNKQTVIFWLSYLLIITYIMSCWWSWDYGGFYGNRVFTEHLVFFALPLAYFFRDFKFKKVAIGLAVVFTLFMWSRAYQINTGITPSRFTQETFFLSMFRLDKTSKGDFAWVQDVKPHGNRTAKFPISAEEKAPVQFDGDKEFGLIHKFDLPNDHAHNRYYFTTTINKTLEPTSDLKDVFLIMDWYDTLTTHREYHSIPLYEYYKESQGAADELVIKQEQYMNPVNDLNMVNIYIWNPQEKEFTVNEFDILVEEYSPEKK
ncbi:MAG: hypothetical protein P8P74_02280 [Crocinitomicaceae bacterium]|nr:hypothetical protein [Crocinitomicaceae bacterium]